MERNLERYYLKFERPPFAPTYYPTEEEFSDPIAYVAKIKADVEPYGAVKIVPPPTFRPPFVIDPEKFEFTPRVQKLNEIDALFRVRIIFINKLVNFWHLQGQQFRLPWAENKYIDLYRVRQLVKEYGGLKKVNQVRLWSQIAKDIGFKPATGAVLKQHFTRWVLPYVRSIEKSQIDDELEAAQVPSTSKDENCAQSMQGQGRRRSSRMMAGVKQKPLPSLDKSSIPIDQVFCNKCGGGGDEDRLLLCETCDRSMHTYCLDPPLSSVPKGDWRCPKCVLNAVMKVSFEFGFLDSNVKFNLESFGEWANNFKEAYFKQAPCDVPANRVEAEFWRNVINIDKDVLVKYGADLITSKMGSGFPRKTDVFKGVDVKERMMYANHPWNLNNLPILRESVLSHIGTGISGMMVPWVYVGMCFSTFCWHVEDHWTYSINYNHWGERKIWYTLSGQDAEKFDSVVREAVPELFVGQPDLLHHMTTALNPRFLIDKGLKVYTVHQNPGEFVITFPRAYHAGYNEGLNFAEAVNFAPPDWLHMGRLCLNNYASVGRTCVFSHEELVMEMVKVADRMSINMCLATLEELRYIIAREADFRKYLTANGLRQSEFCAFEAIPDDERSCQVCKTTLFVSALVCKHSPTRIVCMDHLDQVCDDCKLSDCCLRYRYTLEDFIPLAQKLAQRTTAFEEWKKQISVMRMLASDKEGNSEKLNIFTLRELINHWKSSRYPHCEEIVYVQGMVNNFDKIASTACKVINRKIRLRDNTRCQKADTRYEFAELERLRLELEKLNVRDDSLENSLTGLFDCINKWREKVGTALAKIQLEYGGVGTVDLLLELIYEGEEFNLKIPEMELIKQELVHCQWLVRANQVLDWTSNKKRSEEKLVKKEEMATQQASESFVKSEENDDELTEEDEAEEGEELHRFTIQALSKLLSESARFSGGCATDRVHGVVEALQKMYDDGMNYENQAKLFLDVSEGVGWERADEQWRHFRKVDWLDARYLNTFREELEASSEIHQQFLSIAAESGGDTSRDLSCFSLKVIEHLVALCDRCLFERKGERYIQLKEMCDRLRRFVERIGAMFLKSVGYYNVFEIISGRDDLTALVEGDPVPRVLIKSSKYNDNWSQLKHFNTATLLADHLTAIADQQSNLLMALRLINEKRPLKETCSCGMADAPSVKSAGDFDPQDSIVCFLCNAGFHGVCAQWEPFMARLPEGVFLCPRCLRGRRPCVEDVEAACESAPQNSLERKLVENLLNRSTKAFGHLVSAFHGDVDPALVSDERKKALHEALVMSLSLELIDVDVYRTTFSSPYFKMYFAADETQLRVWNRVRSRMVVAKPLPLIFPISYAASSSGANNGSGDSVANGSGSRRSNKRRSSAACLINSTNCNSTASGSTTTSGINSGSVGEMKLENVAEAGSESAADKNGDGGGSGVKKRCKEVALTLHSDKEFCAADKCLRPYSDQVRWIQCESGCMRWYHYVCVGQTVKAAQQISSYTCYRCS